MVHKPYFDLIVFDCALGSILFLDDIDLGNTIHALVYAVVAGIFLDSILKPSITRRKKALAVLLYYSLLMLQMAILVMGDFSPFVRWLAATLLMITFVVERFIFRRVGQMAVVPFGDEIVLSFEDLLNYRQKLNQKAHYLKQVGVALNPGAVKEMLLDLPRHRVTRYANKDALSQEYLQHLEDSLADPYVYLVFSDTGSVVSTALSVFHRKLYNHISLAFDPGLATLISYNGGEKVSPPGLNPEIIQWFYKKEDASIRIYRLAVTREQKSAMASRVRQIDREGSAYNVLGFTKRRAFAPNIMFCSQFVYCLLQEVGAHYFDMLPEETKPSDLIELDYTRKLEYVETIRLSDIADDWDYNPEKPAATTTSVVAGK